jgi:hypothetical protein
MRHRRLRWLWSSSGGGCMGSRNCHVCVAVVVLALLLLLQQQALSQCAGSSAPHSSACPAAWAFAATYARYTLRGGPAPHGRDQAWHSLVVSAIAAPVQGPNKLCCGHSVCGLFGGCVVIHLGERSSHSALPAALAARGSANSD